jgi:hypothetical protein
MTLDNIIATTTFDTIVRNAIPLVVLMMLSPVMWLKERVWNFTVLQRVCVTFQSCYWREDTIYTDSSVLRPSYFDWKDDNGKRLSSATLWMLSLSS